ncbi:c-type cytochrome [Thermopirellula anaerolimosa]
MKQTNLNAGRVGDDRRRIPRGGRPGHKTVDAGSSAVVRGKVLAITVLIFLGGCSSYKSPTFKLNLEGRDPARVKPAQREAIEEMLTDLFGTPDDPRVPPGVDLNLSLLQRAAGPIGRDITGSERGLFRKHCVVCHGVSGDGAGPIAEMLNPYPRDFRNGVFKFTSVCGGAKPLRSDLLRTLKRGLPGTGMPSFSPLSPEDLDALVEYVRYLSIRGETELFLLRTVVDENEPLPLQRRFVLEEGVRPVDAMWRLAEEQPERYVVVPERPKLTAEELAAAIQRGKTLYQEPRAQCTKCHGPEGRGDGSETELFDDWNKAKKGVTEEQTRELARWFSLPLQPLRPRNFHDGLFHGGGRPEDIYLRIYIGIPGTPMPAAGSAPGTPGVFTSDEIWDLTFFVLSLSRRESSSQEADAAPTDAPANPR